MTIVTPSPNFVQEPSEDDLEEMEATKVQEFDHERTEVLWANKHQQNDLFSEGSSEAPRFPRQTEGIVFEKNHSSIFDALLKNWKVLE